MPPTDLPIAPIRIVVADDHPIFRQGLIKLLETRVDLRVVGSASDGDEVMPLVKSLEPDILLLDMLMPRMPGLAALGELKGLESRTRVLLLTAAIERDDLIAALELGARGVVLKESASDVLLKSIQAVMADRYWIGRKASASQALALADITVSFPAPTRKHFGLTPREREIVVVILAGSSNSDIASRFSISEKTVKHHLTNIFDKLGVSSRLELALFALHHKLDLPAAPAPPDKRLQAGWTSVATKTLLRETS